MSTPCDIFAEGKQLLNRDVLKKAVEVTVFRFAFELISFVYFSTSSVQVTSCNFENILNFLLTVHLL